MYIVEHKGMGLLVLLGESKRLEHQELVLKPSQLVPTLVDSVTALKIVCCFISWQTCGSWRTGSPSCMSEVPVQQYV